MKNKILLSILVLTYVCELGCRKQEPVVQQTKQITSIGSGQLKEAQNNQTLYSHMEYYYSVQCGCMVGVYVWIFCAWPSRNCLPEVVINGNTSYGMQQACDSLFTCSESASMTDYFSGSYYKTLFPNLDSLDGVVDSIINSQIEIHHFYNAYDTADYFIGLPAGSRLTDDWDVWINNSRCVLRVKDRR